MARPKSCALYCKQGHLLTAATVYVNAKTGQRQCKPCAIERQAKWHRENDWYNWREQKAGREYIARRNAA